MPKRRRPGAGVDQDVSESVGWHRASFWPAPSLFPAKALGTFVSRAGPGGVCQEFPGVIRRAPGERLELSPFHFVVGDEECSISFNRCRLSSSSEWYSAGLWRLDDGDEAVVSDGLAFFALFGFEDTNEPGGHDASRERGRIH